LVGELVTIKERQRVGGEKGLGAGGDGQGENKWENLKGRKSNASK